MHCHLPHTVTHCITLRTAIHGSTLERPATHCNALQHTATHCSTLQHTATHCNTLQHTATHCNALQRTATHCNTLQHTATHCNTLQHAATHCDTLRHSGIHLKGVKASHVCVWVAVPVAIIVAMCCRVLHCVALARAVKIPGSLSTFWHRFTVCCSVLQSVSKVTANSQSYLAAVLLCVVA